MQYSHTKVQLYWLTANLNRTFLDAKESKPGTILPALTDIELVVLFIIYSQT